MLLCSRAKFTTCVSPRISKGITSFGRSKNTLAIYSDKALVVLNKPTGVDSQLRITGDCEMRDILVGLEEEGCHIPHPFPVHRLDKATTGALICGKTKSAITDLHGQFKNRTVEKTYLAVVHGGKEKFAGMSGDIESHLRKARGYVSVVDEPGPGDHLAYTSWELLASSTIAPLSLVKLKPKTGFKHQLRAQLAAIGAPILGDARYPPTEISPHILQIMPIPEETMYLHASFASFFRYRKTVKPRQFRLGVMAPLPAYFTQLCAKFQLPVDKEYIVGGVYVNGERVDSGLLDDVGGRWLLPG